MNTLLLVAFVGFSLCVKGMYSGLVQNESKWISVATELEIIIVVLLLENADNISKRYVLYRTINISRIYCMFDTLQISCFKFP